MKKRSLVYVFVVLCLFMFSRSSCREDSNRNQANTNPTASFTITPAEGTVETLFRFDASASYDKEDGIDLQYRWDWEYDWVWDVDWGDQTVQTHKFDVPGIYQIRLEVMDTEGWTGDQVRQLQVLERKQ